MNPPKISVIVPIYNVEPYLDRCVKSIVNQTYKNLEIILVDDGSPDKCPQMCDEWQKKDNRIVVIHKTNGGVASARNVALDIATGEYISFVDGDDFVSDDFIETLYNLCALHKCDIAQCDFIKVYGDSIIPCKAQVDNVKIFSNIQMLDNLFNEYVFTTIVLWSKLYKKHLFENIRLPIIGTGEDEAIMHKIIFSASKIAFSSKRMYMYYHRNESLTKTQYNKQRLDAMDTFEERIRFFDENGLNEFSEKAIVSYCFHLILTYNKGKKYLSDCKDELNGLLDKYKRIYRRALFHKSISLECKLKIIAYRIFPRIPAWLGNKYVQ